MILLAAVCGIMASAEEKKPNVILIYTDDHGYTDLGLFGIDKHVDTPVMDKLASGGALMKAGYSSAPQCVPSRAGLMIGRIQNEFAFPHNQSDAGEGSGRMPRIYPKGTDRAGKPVLTIADRLKKLGYLTGFSGKWHLGPSNNSNPKHDPRARGFEYYWTGSMESGSTNLTLDGKTVEHQDRKGLPEGIANRVILQGKYGESFIDFSQAGDKPFFLYLPLYAPHIPLIKKSDPYYQKFPKLDYPHYDNWRDDRRRMGLALIKSIDDAVGGVMTKLQEHGIEENTMVLFASDNGAPSKMGRDDPGLPGGPPGTRGGVWNGSNNVPMRGEKGSLFEGGIRVPMFAYWKGKIIPGTVIQEMVTTLDLTATTLKAGGGVIPEEFDGVDLLPRLTGKASKIKRPEPMFWEFWHTQVVRIGDWKLWRSTQQEMLFNLAKDPYEINNRIQSDAKVAERLRKKLDQWSVTLPRLNKSDRDASEVFAWPLEGTPAGTKPDPRYLLPYADPKPAPYPAAIKKAEKPKQANILIIFTDDQGYADLGCFGSKENQTPVLDNLAREGTKFTSFYAQPVCGPSRSALLTGRYPARSKGWSMPASEITFAEMLKEVGYQTACVGKWDVSNRKAIVDRMPNAQGFDYYFGALGANDSGKSVLHNNNDLVGTTDDMAGLTRLYTDKAIDYLVNQRDSQKPFLLYLSHTMMHTIIDASPKFKEKTGDNLYRAVVEEFDYETGRLLDTLDELGLKENTLVIFTTDNGPWNQPKYYENKKGHPKNSIFWGDAGPLRDGKASIYEGGIRVPCIMRWPGKIAAGKTNDGLMATIDFLPTFAALTGAKIPDDRTIDGVNQLDFILGKSKTARSSYLYNPGSASVQTRILQGNAIREGDWKLISPLKVGWFLEDAGSGEWELYNLKEDIGETTNLADKYPKKVKRLQALLKSSEAKLTK
ncbi:sulfatase-like hydrolase/transferase [Verrucomicrobia bacterium]|nr:sulfatase-like hydrolase/transferase [Verrucomicrobiota bacterium]